MVTQHPDEFDPERSVGYLTKRAYQLARIGMEPVFENEEVTHVQWSALMALLYGWSTRRRGCPAISVTIPARRPGSSMPGGTGSDRTVPLH